MPWTNSTAIDFSKPRIPRKRWFQTDHCRYTAAALALGVEHTAIHQRCEQAPLGKREKSVCDLGATVGQLEKMCAIFMPRSCCSAKIYYIFMSNQTNSGLCCLFRPLVVSILPTAPVTAPWIAPSFALRTVPSHQLPHTKPHLYFHDSSHISLGLSLYIYIYINIHIYIYTHTYI